MNDFLPKDYKEPEAASKYLQKIPEGNTTIRILDTPQLGWQGWKDTYKDSKKISSPTRAKLDSEIGYKMEEFDNEIRDVKFIWAMTVYNYEEKAIQLWSIHQASIRKQISKLNQNQKWGNPNSYDITINREGKELSNTVYSLQPNPKEDIDPKIWADFLVWQEMFSWDNWWKSEDPFIRKEELNLDKIEKEVKDDN